MDSAATARAEAAAAQPTAAAVRAAVAGGRLEGAASVSPPRFTWGRGGVKKRDQFYKSHMQIDGARGTMRRVREKGTIFFFAHPRRVPNGQKKSGPILQISHANRRYAWYHGTRRGCVILSGSRLVHADLAAPHVHERVVDRYDVELDGACICVESAVSLHVAAGFKARGRRLGAWRTG